MDSIGLGASDRNARYGAQVQEHKSGTVMGLVVDRWEGGGATPMGIFKDSWHQAEVGDSPRLKPLPVCVCVCVCVPC